jgi:hypothetical protein
MSQDKHVFIKMYRKHAQTKRIQLYAIEIPPDNDVGCIIHTQIRRRWFQTDSQQFGQTEATCLMNMMFRF